MKAIRWRLNRKNIPFTYDKEVKNETSKQWEARVSLELIESRNRHKCNGVICDINGAPLTCELQICSKCGSEINFEKRIRPFSIAN